ncbi:hypothetical protein KFL_012630030 [Klebsormidium nitens]|uniref:Retroviral polymerase SH3-like domain-containing protein n=1 Tax=Klebsormidium nitens TaxID=105231 RepID=A0A1Y1IQ36_KLENI|nr:hypothetical protein KFL_012630030 [Klebsormidium nitens]|eukprot:GAQ93035.1 hypothetical protein KFL_012630030 [Klebsormidium nitens]
MCAEAVVTANYTRNRTPVSAHGRTPWEAFYGNKPNVGHMRVFGAQAYRHVPKQRRRKLDPVSERCVFVGYEPYSKAYKVLQESDGKIMISRDVIFDEGEGHNRVVELSSDSTEGSPEAAGERDTAHATAPAHGHARYAKPTQKGKFGTAAGEHPKGTGQHPEPQSYQEAVGGEESDLYRKSVDEEMRSLLENGTWKIVEKSEGVKPIPMKWVYKSKRDENENVERYKCPLNQIYFCSLHLLFRPASTTFEGTIEVNLDTQEKVDAINGLITNMNIRQVVLVLHEKVYSKLLTIATVDPAKRKGAYKVWAALAHLNNVLRTPLAELKVVAERETKAIKAQGTAVAYVDSFDHGRSARRPVSKRYQLGGVIVQDAAARKVVDWALPMAYLDIPSRSALQLEKRVQAANPAMLGIVEKVIDNRKFGLSTIEEEVEDDGEELTDEEGSPLQQQQNKWAPELKVLAPGLVAALGGI